jgi:hypothetical protein
VVLLILPAVYGVRSDPKIEEFIKSPGVVDKFTAAKGQNPAPKNAETSPLIKQAAGYGQILNPPPPPPPKTPPVGTPQGPATPAPPVVAVKFDIVATSYYASHPEQSFVLIDEPGKGLHWVKQGSAVGHLTIDKVKDGAIVVRDGQRTSEMAVKVQEPYKKLLKNPSSSTSPSSSSAPPAGPAAQVPTGRPGPESPIQPSSVTTDKSVTSTPARTSIPTVPGRINPRARIMPPASERITSAAQPAPTTGQLTPTEPVQTPPASQITQPSTAANPPVQPDQPAQPAAPPVVEPLTFEKETEARIQKLTEGPGPSKIAGDEMAKLKKLTEEFVSPKLTADEAEAKLDELNALFSQLEKRKGVEQSATPQSQSSSPSASAAADANK